ncbi:MAG TPA: hypothetical protein PLI96_11740 [Halothiobacillus sp.]|nr:hypothetical protein [Halothiobacillus sp.]
MDRRGQSQASRINPLMATVGAFHRSQDPRGQGQGSYELTGAVLARTSALIVLDGATHAPTSIRATYSTV